MSAALAKWAVLTTGTPLWQLYALCSVNTPRNQKWWTATQLEAIGLESEVRRKNPDYTKRTYRLSRTGKVVIVDLEKWLAHVREQNAHNKFMTDAELVQLETDARVAWTRRHLETWP